jgi:hypothetical protein
VLAPAVPAAIVHWYRITQDSPLHALGAELWMGNDRVTKIEPVHCLGLTELQVKTLLVRIEVWLGLLLSSQNYDFYPVSEHFYEVRGISVSLAK